LAENLPEVREGSVFLDKVTEICGDKTGNCLKFALMRGRKEGEIVAEKYKIIVEKISDFE